MNTEPKLTDWFPGHVKPVRVGDYNASPFRNSRVKRHWDGKRWSRGWVHPGERKHAWTMPCNGIDQSSMHWRGLAEQPWIEWKGGTCPVQNEGPRVQVKFRCNLWLSSDASTCSPGQLRWSHNGNDGDIMAYRVLEECA